MIKDAVAMKLQKKCRDQLHIPAIGFFSKYRGALLAGTFKIQPCCERASVRQERKFFGKTLNDSCCLKPIVNTTLCFLVELFQTNLDKTACEIRSLSLDSI